jgi:hypothetical protein
MAARKRAWTPEKVRERMRTTMLVRRLTKHVLGKVDMSATQVTAALGLLKKTLPDLNAIEHTGEIKHRDVSDQPLTAEQWEERYSGNHLAPASRPPESVN